MTRFDYYLAAWFVLLAGAGMALDATLALIAGQTAWGVVLVIGAICTTPLIIKLVREP